MGTISVLSVFSRLYTWFSGWGVGAKYRGKACLNGCRGGKQVVFPQRAVTPVSKRGGNGRRSWVGVYMDSWTRNMGQLP